jgi:serine/threonine protein kinase
MLVMMKLDVDLCNYLQQNQNHLSWKKKIKIICNVINALNNIHEENAVHRDLHSGNILYNRYSDYWLISDLGFCGPVDKPLNSTYGKLPYIAPEAIFENEYTFASDIYSIGILMWEISSGKSPFVDYENNYENEYDLTMKIIRGMRPKVVPETPLKYEELMKQCWDADPTKRPDIKMLSNKINDMNRSYYPNISNNKSNIFRKFLKKSKKTNNLNVMSSSEVMISSEVSSCSSRLLGASKIYKFDNLPEPRNATEGIL